MPMNAPCPTPKRNLQSKRNAPPALGLVLPGLIVGIWWIVTEAGWVSPLVIPSPRTVFQTLIHVAQHGYRDHSLLYHLATSLRRLALGFGLAVAVAVPLGLLMGHRLVIKRLFYPIIELLRPLPPLGYYALLVLWFGIYETSKVLLLFLAALTPILITTVDAVERTPTQWVQAGESMGMSRRQLYRYVLLPAALPGVFTGMRMGLGFAFTTLVAAEMVAAHAGIGWMVLDAGRYLRNDLIFTGNLILGLTAYCLDRGTLLLRRRLLPWAVREPE